MSVKIQIRRDTAAAWTAANPVLASGEPAMETDTRKRKTGDGATAWVSLPYDVPTLAAVATSGAYADLGGKPTIPTTASQVGAQPAGDYATNTSVTSGLAGKADATATATALAGKADAAATTSALAAKADQAATTTALAGKADAAATTTALAAKADLVAGLIPTSQLPSLAIGDTVVVANQAAMLALTTSQVQKGDVAVRTDGAGSFRLTAADPSQLANWVSLDTRTDVVTTVNGQAGTVVLAKSDVGLGSVDNTADVNKPVSTAQAAAIAAKYTRPGAGIPAADLAADVPTAAQVTANTAAISALPAAYGLTPTVMNTAPYTVASGELAMMNVPGGATVLTLPTAPADKTRVAARAIGATTAVPLTITAGGSDTIGDAGATSMTQPLASESTLWQYQASATRWLAIDNVKPLAALDLRYEATVPRTGATAGQVPVLQSGGGLAFGTISGSSGLDAGTQWLSVKAYGAVGDGTTNCSTAFQNALTAAKALVTSSGQNVAIYVPSGTYALSVASGGDFFTWASRISLIGAGRHTTRIVLSTASGATAAANFVRGQGGTSTPLVECHFRSFEIDMTGVFAPSTGYSPVQGKAFYMQYNSRSSWSDLYIHGTKATAVGVDFLQDCFIQNNLITDCGNFSATVGAGDSGIGIGTGVYQDENIAITGNIVLRCRNHGIFVEKQSGAAYFSRGTIIANNDVRGCYIGIADRGVQGAIIMGNNASDNTNTGILVANPQVGTGTNPGRETLIVNNIAARNLNGVDVIGALGTGRIVIRGNRVNDNTNIGIIGDWDNTTTTSTTPAPPCAVIDNDIHGNVSYGISFGPLSNSGYGRDLAIERNRVYNNGGTSTRTGIRLKMYLTRLRLVDNVLWDDQATATQVTGIAFVQNVAVTGGVIRGNDARGCGTPWNFQASALAGNIVVADNPGLTLGGPVAVTVGASPFTYTAGFGPEDVYIDGGTVSSITKGGLTIASATGRHVALGPAESMIVTYSAAPTIVADKR